MTRTGSRSLHSSQPAQGALFAYAEHCLIHPIHLPSSLSSDMPASQPAPCRCPIRPIRPTTHAATRPPFRPAGSLRPFPWFLMASASPDPNDSPPGPNLYTCLHGDLAALPPNPATAAWSNLTAWPKNLAQPYPTGLRPTETHTETRLRLDTDLTRLTPDA